MPCPAGGVCQGGLNVTFERGSWVQEARYWKLTSCPPGSTKEVESTSGEFQHDLQQCRRCSSL
eukprot:1405208-Rhodomonas_salina.1